jgi:hypothetical protein
MKYDEIKNASERCEGLPLADRLHEEVAELRAFIEQEVVREVYIFGWNSALEMVAYQIMQMRAFPSDTRESFGVFVKQHRKGLH